MFECTSYTKHSVLQHLLAMLTETLLVVVIALCLQDTLEDGVRLEAVHKDSRTGWGENDIQLICRDYDHDAEIIIHAIFTRNGNPITTNDSDACTPGGFTYCAIENGERLYFIASSVTEGWFACKNNANVTSDELAIIGERFYCMFYTSLC